MWISISNLEIADRNCRQLNLINEPVLMSQLKARWNVWAEIFKDKSSLYKRLRTGVMRCLLETPARDQHRVLFAFRSIKPTSNWLFANEFKCPFNFSELSRSFCWFCSGGLPIKISPAKWVNNSRAYCCGQQKAKSLLEYKWLWALESDGLKA